MFVENSMAKTLAERFGANVTSSKGRIRDKGKGLSMTLKNFMITMDLTIIRKNSGISGATNKAQYFFVDFIVSRIEFQHEFVKLDAFIKATNLEADKLGVEIRDDAHLRKYIRHDPSKAKGRIMRLHFKSTHITSGPASKFNAKPKQPHVKVLTIGARRTHTHIYIYIYIYKYIYIYIMCISVRRSDSRLACGL